jgi:pimeloyl-ACP methyl ester carboxylesterase
MAFFTTKDGCKLFYEEHGKGENLIFVHGWSCNQHFFDPQIEYYSKKYHVVDYDFRGHGESDRGEITERNMSLSRFGDDLFELIEFLGLKKTHVVAWSMGMSTVLAYVRAHGVQYLDKLCLIDMTPKLLNDNKWQLGQGCNFTHEMNVDFMEQIAVKWEGAADLFTPNIFAKGMSPENPIFKWTKGEILKNTPHVMMNMWVAMAYEDFRDIVPKITIPVMLAYGEDGFIYFPAHAEWMAAHLSGPSKIVLFPKCGHTLFREAPDKFNEELESFLKDGK